MNSPPGTAKYFWTGITCTPEDAPGSFQCRPVRARELPPSSPRRRCTARDGSVFIGCVGDDVGYSERSADPVSADVASASLRGMDGTTRCRTLRMWCSERIADDVAHK